MQDAVDEFALDEAAEEREILLGGDKVQHSTTGVEEFHGGFGDGQVDGRDEIAGFVLHEGGCAEVYAFLARSDNDEAGLISAGAGNARGWPEIQRIRQ